MNSRRFTGTLLALLFALSILSAPAFAAGDEPGSGVTAYQIGDPPVAGMLTGQDADAPVLKDVRTAEQGGQTLLVKTWDALPGYAPDLLVEEDFEKGGLRYKKAYLLLVSENYDSQSKLASETVTVSHEGRDDALASLQPIMDYDQDGFSGQLTLQADAIVTEAVGQSSYSYNLTDMREYPGLERNDPYLVPKTVEKNGARLQLADIGWTQAREGGYTATASYRGSASGTAVTGYISTATYIGEVSKEVLENITYAVVYEGSVIPPAPFDFSPYLIAGISAVVILIAAVVFLSRRDNTKIYAMIGREYQLVHKQKLTSLAPIIDLSPREISGQSDEFMIVLGRLAVRKMRGHSIKIIGKDGMMKMQRIYKVRHFRIGQSVEEDFDS